MNHFDRGRAYKCVSVFLLVFQAFFLNVVVPGHTRGVIRLSSSCCGGTLADLGCPFCAERTSDDPKKSPGQQDRSECAICHLAIRITTTPPVDFRLGELGFLKLIPPPAPEVMDVVAAVPVHFCRGPPILFV